MCRPQLVGRHCLKMRMMSNDSFQSKNPNIVDQMNQDSVIGILGCQIFHGWCKL